jgi:hypothetical protein
MVYITSDIYVSSDSYFHKNLCFSPVVKRLTAYTQHKSIFRAETINKIKQYNIKDYSIIKGLRKLGEDTK